MSYVPGRAEVPPEELGPEEMLEYGYPFFLSILVGLTPPQKKKTVKVGTSLGGLQKVAPWLPSVPGQMLLKQHRLHLNEAQGEPPRFGADDARNLWRSRVWYGGLVASAKSLTFIQVWSMAQSSQRVPLGKQEPSLFGDQLLWDTRLNGGEL